MDQIFPSFIWYAGSRGRIEVLFMSINQLKSYASFRRKETPHIWLSQHNTARSTSPPKQKGLKIIAYVANFNCPPITKNIENDSELE